MITKTARIINFSFLLQFYRWKIFIKKSVDFNLLNEPLLTTLSTAFPEGLLNGLIFLCGVFGKVCKLFKLMGVNDKSTDK